MTYAYLWLSVFLRLSKRRTGVSLGKVRLRESLDGRNPLCVALEDPAERRRRIKVRMTSLVIIIEGITFYFCQGGMMRLPIGGREGELYYCNEYADRVLN